MKTLVVRIPDSVAAEIDATARARGVSKSDVARERLARPDSPAAAEADPLAAIRDLIGSVDGGRPDLSSNKKEHLRALIRARKSDR